MVEIVRNEAARGRHCSAREFSNLDAVGRNRILVRNLPEPIRECCLENFRSAMVCAPLIQFSCESPSHSRESDGPEVNPGGELLACERQKASHWLGRREREHRLRRL